MEKNENPRFLQKLSLKFKELEGEVQLLAIPLLLLIVLLILGIANKIIQNETDRQDVQAYTTFLPVHPYPLLKNFYDPQISAESAIVMENDSKGILYKKNPTLRFSMASTTKVMTALTALDYFKPGYILTVQREKVEGTVLGLHKGQQLTLQFLLYAMLLPSANDAAFVIADNYPGGEEAFVEKMNEKAQFFGLKNTHYGDPAGLNDDQDYTTVFDLAQIASQVQAQPLLLKVASTKEMKIKDVSGKEYELTNLNRLLGNDGVTGLKTGQTTGAGGVLVTTAVKDGHTYIVVVMRSEDRFLDALSLLRLLDKNITYFQPVLF